MEITSDPTASSVFNSNIVLHAWLLTCFLLAIYTQPGGPKTTTIKNALSELYNMSSVENNMITSKRFSK